MFLILMMIGCSRPCGSSYSGSCKPIDTDGLCYDPSYTDESLSTGDTGVYEWVLAGLRSRDNYTGPDTGLPDTCLHARVLDCGAVTAIAKGDPNGIAVFAFDPEGRIIGRLFAASTTAECNYVAVGQEEAAACMAEARTWMSDSAHRCNSTTCDEGFCAQLE